MLGTANSQSMAWTGRKQGSWLVHVTGSGEIKINKKLELDIRIPVHIPIGGNSKWNQIKLHPVPTFVLETLPGEINNRCIASLPISG